MENIMSPQDMLEKLQSYQRLAADYEVSIQEYSACGYSTEILEKKLKMWNDFADYWKGQLEAAEPNMEVF